jgi:hypothetical protein
VDWSIAGWPLNAFTFIAQTFETIERLPSGGGGDPTCGPFPTATGLGFTGFFFPLFKPMLGMGGNPAIRQQGFQRGSVPRGDGRNLAQHVCQVGGKIRRD